MSSLDSKQDVHVTALHQTLTFGPFSVVSTPQTARLGSFFSIFQNILNLHALFGRKEPNSRLEQRKYMKLDETYIVILQKIEYCYITEKMYIDT